MIRRTLAAAAILAALVGCGTPTVTPRAAVDRSLPEACERALDLADQVISDLATTGSDLLEVIEALNSGMEMTAAQLMVNAEDELEAYAPSNRTREAAAAECRDAAG